MAYLFARFICFDMSISAILSEEELLALLVSSDEKLEKVDHLKRVQLISLCQAQARALAHFRSAPQNLPQSPAVCDPVILSIIIVSEDTTVGGAGSDHLVSSETCYCEQGVGTEHVILDTRSVSSQITTTRPATGRSSSRRLAQQAPPARIERHYYHSVDSSVHVVDSQQDIHAVSDSSEREDESEYPPGYYDESDDNCETKFAGPISFPHFSSSQLEQQHALDTGFQDGCYGGVLEASEAEFFPQQNVYTGQSSSFVNDTGPVDDDCDYTYDTRGHFRDDEHCFGGVSGDEHDYGHYDYESGGAGYDSDGGYSSGYY